MALTALREGSLVKVLEEYCPSYDPLFLYFPSRRFMPPKLRAFVDFAKAASSGAFEQ